MRRGFLCLALLLAAPPMRAQEVTPTKLTLRPAAAPVPALKFQLAPDLVDQTPGNAAILYYRAFSPEWQSYRREPGFDENIDKWLKMPLKELSQKELQWLLNAGMLRELDEAARREHCDWQLTPQLRREGVSMLMPDLQGFRQLARLLALRARLEMAEGHFDKAVYTLQTGFTLARHVGEQPLLISALVGMAMAQVMAEQVETLSQTPGAPNLYWALTQLPRPFVELRRPLQGEKLLLYATLPMLRDIETTTLAPQQIEQQLEKLVQLYEPMGDSGSLPWKGKAGLIAQLTKVYPQARRALISEGRKPEEVKAMPVLQVVLIYSLHQYDRLRDDMYKWTNLPYWQAYPRLREAEKQVQRAKANTEEGLPFAALLLPAIVKVQFSSVRLDRRLAALRCIEAIRLHAAAHDSKLPEKLSDIGEVPIPLDPVTGKAFEYKLSGDQATLYGPPPSGEKPTTANVLSYELTLAH